jgi:hypothetical protein
VAKQGMHSVHDFGSNCVILMLGESEVARWPVPAGENLDTQWRVDRFTARKLGSILDFVESSQMDVET